MKNLFKNEEFLLDEILFQGRNKEYGAFVLRHEADRVLTKSMFIGIGLFAAVAITPLIISAFGNTGGFVVPDEGSGPVWVDPPVIDEPVVAPPPTVVPPKQVETFNSIVPTPKKTLTKPETPAATIDKYYKAVAGTQDVKGDPPTTPYVPPVVPSVSTGPVTVPAPQPKVENPNEIADKVDVEAAFNGGIDSFRNKVGNNFDTSNFDGSGEMLKTTVTFIVERDGTITNIKASGPDAAFNREAERTVKSVKGKWIPAKVKGQAVRSYFKFPVTMQFE